MQGSATKRGLDLSWRPPPEAKAARSYGPLKTDGRGAEESPRPAINVLGEEKKHIASAHARDPVDRVLALLDAIPDGNGWKARCPAHPDRGPSLSIGRGGDGRC